jgi:hypothetical protein
VKAPLIVSFGAGVNSTALVCGLVERDIVPDAILFADTGGERPETYAHLRAFDDWLRTHGMPTITVLKKGGRPETLEENCLRMKMLPSLAYGFKGCSHKYKIEPQEIWANQTYREHFKGGGRVKKAIGYGAEETRRATIESDAKYDYWYPLISWDLDRDDCLALIERAGAPLPGKSACFFCPGSKLSDIRALRSEHPALFARALAMEANAELKTVKGLGRRFAWRDVDQTPRATEIDMPCACHEGAA